MRLWTIQIESEYQDLQNNGIIYRSKPTGIEPYISDWFLEKTKFNHWPIWCWLHVPPQCELEKYCSRIHHNNKENSYLLKLNVPNNEKMIFIPDSSWKEIIQDKSSKKQFNKLFDISYSTHSDIKICVCINMLNSYWIEKSYLLNSSFTHNKNFTET